MKVTFPKEIHNNLQHQMADLLRPVAGAHAAVRVEFPVRAEPEFEMRGA